ncbi:MAG: cytochrome c3 family protein [Myxococcota bacterium]
MTVLRLPLLISVIALCAPLSCTQSLPSTTAADLSAALEGRGGTFTHGVHMSEEKVDERLECESCHPLAAEEAYVTRRPGHDHHAPCDRCHETAFREPPGALCKNCHLSVDPMVEGKSVLYPYPSTDPTVALVSRFNHRRHLEEATRERRGSGLACRDCHAVGETNALAAFPDHTDCSDCHAEVAVPRMSDCQGCHERDGPGRSRKFLCNDIRFSHEKHLYGLEGEDVDCGTCHIDIPGSTDSAQLNLPLMSDCATCHDRSDRTPDRVRIDNCGLCHQDAVDSQPLPRNHTGESTGDREKARCR